MPVLYEKLNTLDANSIDFEFQKANSNLSCNLPSDQFDSVQFVNLSLREHDQDPSYLPLSLDEQSLFHIEYWSGWSVEKYSHLIYHVLVFMVSILIFHRTLNGRNSSCGPRWRFKRWNRKLMDSNLWITLVIYSLCGLSCVWFVIGIGKQNIDFYANRYLWRYDRILLPIDEMGQRAMAQANLYDLRHVDRIKEYYQRHSEKFKKEYRRTGFDIVIAGYSQENDLSEYEYFPSLVQHIGRASSSPKKTETAKCQIQYLKQAMTFTGSEMCGVG